MGAHHSRPSALSAPELPCAPAMLFMLPRRRSAVPATLSAAWLARAGGRSGASRPALGSRSAALPDPNPEPKPGARSEGLYVMHTLTRPSPARATSSAGASSRGASQLSARSSYPAYTSTPCDITLR